MKTKTVAELARIWNGPEIMDEGSQTQLSELLQLAQRDSGLVSRIESWVPHRVRVNVGTSFQVKCVALGLLMADHGLDLEREDLASLEARCPDFDADLGGWERTIKQSPRGARQPLMDLLAQDLKQVSGAELPFYGLALLTVGLLVGRRVRES